VLGKRKSCLFHKFILKGEGTNPKSSNNSAQVCIRSNFRKWAKIKYGRHLKHSGLQIKGVTFRRTTGSKLSWWYVGRFFKIYDLAGGDRDRVEKSNGRI